jgi:hypothetical protein
MMQVTTLDAAITATSIDVAERSRRVVEMFNEYLVTDFRESLGTDDEEALQRIIAAEFGEGEK